MGALKLTTASSGSVILNPANTASDVTITVPATTATMAINGPAFSYYQSSSQTLSSATATKITFTSSEFDTTSGMYASSRFTPTVAGYYQVNGAFAKPSGSTEMFMSVYKNGSEWKRGSDVSITSSATVSCIVYLNGSTDYIELYGYMGIGAATWNTSYGTYFQASMVRAA